tara:strand:- start:2286 stop:2873 length:588 start_codon:yes stop_codon:yes gene_type:complete
MKCSSFAQKSSPVSRGKSTRELRPSNSDFAELASRIDLGEMFSLVDSTGQRRRWSDFRGQPLALYFGDTSCPKTCAAMLEDRSSLLDGFGDDGQNVAVIMISIDPKRDTPERMAEFLSQFDREIVGLTGSAKEIGKTLTAFAKYRAVIPLDTGSYKDDHSARVYLFDQTGAFFSNYDRHATREAQRQKIGMLIAS